MKLPKLNSKQLNRLSEIAMGIGHVSFASVVIPSIIDKFNIFLLPLGLIAAFGSWFVSMRILGGKYGNR